MSRHDPIAQALLDTPLQRGAAAAPMQRQLHQRLKAAILAGRLAPASRLPSSRTLADALSISRNTVTAAYDLLAVEGYVHPGRQGTRVAQLLPPRPRRDGHSDTEVALAAPAVGTGAAADPGGRGAQAGTAPVCEPVPHAPPAVVVARRLSLIQPGTARAGSDAAFTPGVPALSHFPLAAWRHALDRAIRSGAAAALGYGDPLGEPVLRAAIARHLGMARGVRCAPQQVVITEGAQEALSLCVRALTNPGETAWMENPGYRGAKSAMHAGDLRVQAMPVDGEGLIASEGDWQTRPPRLIYTTPSHQYPGGAVMSVTRRLALIAQARRHGAWIMEDDYDSEFRHAGEPIGAMQGLVEDAPVLYVGTFSKTMFPALRLGFLVLPQALAGPLVAPLREMLRGGHRYEQLALADFIESGQFSRHLGRMRRLYRQRQQALRTALQHHMPLPHTIAGGHGGLHLSVQLPACYPDREIAAAARQHHIAPAALSSFVMPPGAAHNGLVLGYGNTPVERFEPAIRQLTLLMRAAAELG